MAGELQEEVGYPIRVVARRTGLKQDLIRAWERRYGAVTPSRSEGRQRLFSEADIRRLRLLRRATEAGHSIGRIASLDEDDLGDLIAADARDTGAPDLPTAHASPFVSACLEAVVDLDANALEDELLRAGADLGRTRLIDDVLLPLLRAIGAGYEAGTLRPAHERLASSVISAIGQSFRSAYPPADTAPGLVVTTPTDQHHEIGAQLAAAVAASEGWRLVYLGANLPAEEIAAAVIAKECQAVALGIVFPPDDAKLSDELRHLRRLVGDDVAIIAGGASADAYRAALEDVGALVVRDFAQFRRELAELRHRRAMGELGAEHSEQ